MDKGTKRNLAVTAGLTAVLALSPVAGPVVTALADTTDGGQGITIETPVICNKKHFIVNFHDKNGDLIDTIEGDAAFSFDNFPVLSPAKDYVEKLVDEHPEYADASWTYSKPGSSNPIMLAVEKAKFGSGNPDYVIKDESGLNVGYYVEDFYEYAPVPEKTKVTVSFDMNYPEGATGEDENYSVESSEGDYITAPADPTCEGYEFLGWYTDAECTQAYDFKTPVTGDMTLYAKWAPKQFTVTFDDGIEGNEDVTQTVVYNSLATKPADPTREGYTFGGWYTDEECTEGNEYDFTKPVTGDMTLYAKWIQDEEPTEPEQPGTGTEEPVATTHKVTFDDCLASTENAVVEVEDGKTVAKPADPECEGFTFEGWYSDTDLTQEWDFSAPVTEDMTLWAKWSKNGVDGAGVTDDTKTPAAPSKDADKTASDKTASDKGALPSTGDATMAVSGLGALGTAVAGLGAFLKRRH